MYKKIFFILFFLTFLTIFQNIVFSQEVFADCYECDQGWRRNGGECPGGCDPCNTNGTDQDGGGKCSPGDPWNDPSTGTPCGCAAPYDDNVRKACDARGLFCGRDQTPKPDVCPRDARPCDPNDEDYCIKDASGKDVDICIQEDYYCSILNPYGSYGLAHVCLSGKVAPNCSDDEEVISMKIYNEPSSNPNRVRMDSIKPGDDFWLNVSGVQGSTHIKDELNSSIIMCDFVDSSSGFWGDNHCKAVASGWVTWTHSWKNCAPNACTGTNPVLSSPCKKAISIRIGDVLVTPPPLKSCIETDSNGNIIKYGQCKTPLGVFDVTNPGAFITQLFSVILAIAGIAALMLIIYSGYLLMTSAGDKQKVQGARETITSAIAGLLFIVFSIAILEFIGVDIFHIPGLGR